MTQQEPTRCAECRHFAALLESPTASAQERQAALAHLATCPWRRAEQRADARLDAALLANFGPAARSPLRTADLLVAIGATHEPAAAPASAAPQLSPIRSVVNLGDFDGGFDRMSEQEAHGDAQRTGERADAPAGERAAPRKVAAIPSLRPGPRRPGTQAWTVGFGATAAVIAIIVITVSLFSSRGRPPAHSANHASATQTASATAKITAASEGPIAAISMVSSTDGWALGQLNSTNTVSSQSRYMLYHFDGSTWTISPNAPLIPLGGQNSPTLTMLASDDGWIVDGAQMYHYDGSAWRLTPLRVASGGQQVVVLQAAQMLSPTEGYASAIMTGPAPQNVAFLRFDGSQWTVDLQSFTLPAGQGASLYINAISAQPGGDAWAVGTVQYNQNTQGISPQIGLIFHRVNGVWTLADQLNTPNGSALYPSDILMTGPTAGWIVGSIIQYQSTTFGVQGISHALLLRYDYHVTGSRWVEVTPPIDIPSSGDALMHIAANGQNDIWASGDSAGGAVTNGVSVMTLLFHYDGSTWTRVIPSFPSVTGVTYLSLFRFGATPDGAIWGIGAEGMANADGSPIEPRGFFCSYSGGVWRVLPISPSK